MKKVSKDFFYNSSDEPKKSSSRQSVKAHTYQFPINESEEFYDPFSDISLFLAKKIKKQVLSSKKKNWNTSIQKTLINEILPEFIHKFPKYHLRVSALQKTFDKVQYYIKTLRQQNGQITESGKINLHKIIRENLRQTSTQNHSQHPFNLSHSLAVRISECIATVDNTRPNIVELTKLIWSGQKNLLLKKDLKTKCPFENFNSQDRLIARMQIETIAQTPNIDQKSLRESIKKKLVYLQQLKRMRCKKTLDSLFWTVLADRTSHELSFKRLLNQNVQTEILEFIKTVVNDEAIIHRKHLPQSAKRIEFLFSLCNLASKEQVKTELLECITYIQALNQNKLHLTRKPMKDAIFDFLYHEINLHTQGTTKEHIANVVLQHFDTIKTFCAIPKEVLHEIPLLFFRVVNLELNPLKGISKAMQEVVFNEICYQKLEKNNLESQDAIDKSIEYIQNQEIQINGIVKSIYPWILQNDMIFQYLYFDDQTPLFQSVKSHFNNKLLMTGACLEKAINEICSSNIKRFKSLLPFKTQLRRQILILYKAIYYNSFSSLTPYQLFLQYHFMLSLGRNQAEFQEVQITTLFSKSEELTPLMPFSRNQIRHLINDVNKQLKFA